MPTIPTMTSGRLLIGDTGADPVVALPTDTASLDWTLGSGTQTLLHEITLHTTVAAAGTTQGAATALDVATYYSFHVITADASNYAIKLTATTKRIERIIVNEQAQALTLFPESGGTINFGAVNAGVTISAGIWATVYCRGNGLWIVSSEVTA